MKKVINASFVMAIIAVTSLFASCGESQKVTKSPVTSQAGKKDDMIIFKTTYRINSKNLITYDNTDILRIGFYTTGSLKFASKLFLYNYRIKDEKVVIKKSDLNNLTELPAGSKGKVEAVKDVLHNKNGGIIGFLVTFRLDKKTSYSFWFIITREDSFAIDKETAGVITIDGEEDKEATVEGESYLNYEVGEEK